MCILIRTDMLCCRRSVIAHSRPVFFIKSQANDKLLQTTTTHIRWVVLSRVCRSACVQSKPRVRPVHEGDVGLPELIHPECRSLFYNFKNSAVHVFFLKCTTNAAVSHLITRHDVTICNVRVELWVKTVVGLMRSHKLLHQNMFS